MYGVIELGLCLGVWATLVSYVRIEGRVWGLLAIIRWQGRTVNLEGFRLQGLNQLLVCSGCSPSPRDEDNAR